MRVPPRILRDTGFMGDSEPLETWFKREILGHEEMLMRFLSRVWRNRDELTDIRQEAYARVYEASLKSRPTAPKAFLFATARHLMADRVRRERIVSIRAGGDSDFLNVLVDELTPERRASAGEELARLAHAFDRLTDKCREVVWLRRVKDMSQREVAEHLGLSEKTVEKHLRTGARLLAHYTRTNALIARVTRGSRDTNYEIELDEIAEDNETDKKEQDDGETGT
jgi:RNA polymerase sigma factor (sigma-70 family)